MSCSSGAYRLLATELGALGALLGGIAVDELPLKRGEG